MVSLLHVLLGLGLAVRDKALLDKGFLQLFQLVSPSAGVLVITVTHPFEGGQLQPMGVSEASATARESPVITELEVVDLPVQDPDVVTGPPELGVQVLESVQQLLVLDGSHFVG